MISRREKVRRRLAWLLNEAVSIPVTLATVAAFALLPRGRKFALSKPLGWICRAVLKRPIQEKMRTLFPEVAADPAAFRRLWSRYLRNVGLSVFEIMMLYRMTPEESREIVAVEGLEHLAGALKEGRGAMLLLNHLGNIGCMPSYFGLNGYDISIAGNAMPSAFVEGRVQSMYRAVGAKRVLLGDNLPSRAAQAFRRNGIFCTYIDLPVTEKHTHWFAFGPGEIRAHLGPAILALRNRVPVLCVNTVRIADNRHRLVIHPPMRGAAGGDVTAEARRLTHEALRLLYDDLRAAPEQWWAWDFTPVRRAAAVPPSNASHA